MSGIPLTPPSEVDGGRHLGENQASASGTASEPGPSTYATGPTVYQKLLPTIANLSIQRNFREIINVAEEVDLNVEHGFDETRLLITMPLVLSYLIIDDLPPARHALARLPEGLHTHPLFHALSKLLLAVWDKVYGSIYTFAQELDSLVQQPDHPNKVLTGLVKILVEAFVGSFRSRTMVLLAKVYSSLSLNAAQVFLGLPTESVLSVAQSSHWSYNASTHTLSPSSTSHTATRMFGSNLSTLESVVDITARLESSM